MCSKLRASEDGGEDGKSALEEIVATCVSCEDVLLKRKITFIKTIPILFTLFRDVARSLVANITMK